MTKFIKPVINFDEVAHTSKMRLAALGCRPWDGSGLMLFPSEWFDIIPDGFRVTDIFGKTKPFVRAEASDDRRFGCLSFGVVATS